MPVFGRRLSRICSILVPDHLSKIRLDVQWIELSAVLNSQSRATVHGAGERCFSVQPGWPPLPDRHGDPNRLQQVFWNLLTTPSSSRHRTGKSRCCSNTPARVPNQRNFYWRGHRTANSCLHFRRAFSKENASTTRRQGGGGGGGVGGGGGGGGGVFFFGGVGFFFCVCFFPFLFLSLFKQLLNCMRTVARPERRVWLKGRLYRLCRSRGLFITGKKKASPSGGTLRENPPMPKYPSPTSILVVE